MRFISFVPGVWSSDNARYVFWLFVHMFRLFTKKLCLNWWLNTSDLPSHVCLSRFWSPPTHPGGGDGVGGWGVGGRGSDPSVPSQVSIKQPLLHIHSDISRIPSKESKTQQKDQLDFAGQSESKTHTCTLIGTGSWRNYKHVRGWRFSFPAAAWWPG